MGVRISKLEKNIMTKLFTILDAKAVDGVGTNLNVSEHDTVVIMLATDGGGDATMIAKIQGSIDKTPPEFENAVSLLNHWSYIQSVEVDNGEPINGSAGIGIVSQDKYMILELNVNGLNWINIEVSGRTAGELTAKAKMFNSNK